MTNEQIILNEAEKLAPATLHAQCSASASGSSRDTSGNPAPRSHLLIVRSEIWS